MYKISKSDINFLISKEIESVDINLYSITFNFIGLPPNNLMQQNNYYMLQLLYEEKIL
jgi:hypothetical protein